MRHWLVIFAICLIVSGGALMAPWALSEVHAQEVAPLDCEAWYAHHTALTDQIAHFAAARATGTEEQRAEARRRFVADCERVVADPAAYTDDMELLRCTMDAQDAQAWMTCVDPFPPKPTGAQAEAEELLSGIRTAERAYHAAWDTYLPCKPTPADVPGVERVPFVGGGEGDFRTLGWLPNGPVQCRYSVTISDEGFDFEVRAECDEDGDGEISIWRTTPLLKPERVTPAEVR